MASTYGNDLRLEEIGDGEQSGTWGATTNTNLELISEALSFGTEAITTNANTHTTTIADGATDPGRSLYLKYTGTLDSTCTITIAPNSISKTWYIENGTGGSQSIIISQGSGANVTIPTGQTKIVYSDGAGSGAAMGEIGTLGVTNLAVTTNATVGGTLGVTGVLTGTSLDISGNVDIDGTTNLDAVDIDGAVQLDATLTVGANDQGYDVTLHGDTAARNVKWDSSADSLIFSDNAKAVFGNSADLQIYHAGTGSVISDQGTGNLYIDGTSLDFRNAAANKTYATMTDGAAVSLYHNNAIKAATTATGLTVSGSVVDNLTRGSIKVGNSSGVFAPLAKGAAGTVLTSDGTDLSFASIAAGMADVAFPSNWASPTNNYTSSGTWSKGSLSDDDYVWIYLVGSGGGGGARYNGVGDVSNGGAGGYALLVFGQAKYFDGGAYVVGAAKAGTNTGGSNNDYTGTPGNPSTFTLTSTYNSLVYTTASGALVAETDDTTAGRVRRHNPTIDDVIDLTNLTPDFTITSQVNYSEITDLGMPTGVNFRYVAGERWYDRTGTPYSIFGGGQGGNRYNTNNPPGTSVFAGAGGAMGTSSGGNGTAPGGGGGGVSSSNGVGGTGAQGSVRIYHV